MRESALSWHMGDGLKRDITAQHLGFDDILRKIQISSFKQLVISSRQECRNVDLVEVESRLNLFQITRDLTCLFHLSVRL